MNGVHCRIKYRGRKFESEQILEKCEDRPQDTGLGKDSKIYLGTKQKNLHRFTQEKRIYYTFGMEF